MFNLLVKCLCLFYYISCATAELSLLVDHQNQTAKCVVTGNDLDSAVTWNLENVNATTEDNVLEFKGDGNWERVRSFEFNIPPVTDERWENFKILKSQNDVDHKIPITKPMKYISLSVNSDDIVNLILCRSEVFKGVSCFIASLSKNSFTGNCYNRSCQQIYNKSYISWSISHNTWAHINIADSRSDNDLPFDKSFINIKLLLDNINFIILRSKSTAYWKLHDYTFFLQHSESQPKPFTQMWHGGGHICIYFFIFLCKHCNISVTISHKTANHERPNEYTYKDGTWRRVVINDFIKSEADIIVSVGTYSFVKTNNETFAISDIYKCIHNNESRVSTVKIRNQKNLKCSSLTTNKSITIENEKKTFSCPLSQFGAHCNISCERIFGKDTEYCQNHRICDTKHGCVCSWGYTGDKCNQKCTNKKWGTNCNNFCGRCKDDAPCEVSTGLCKKGCFQGYKGQYCSIDLPVLKNGPVLVQKSYTWIKVKFSLAYRGSMKPLYVKCQYRLVEGGKRWKNFTQNIFKNKFFECNITNLQPGILIEIRAVLFSKQASYDEEDVPKGTFGTICDDITHKDVKITEVVKSTANITTINRVNSHFCPISSYFISIENNDKMNSNTKYLENLLPCTTYKIQFTNRLTNSSFTKNFITKPKIPIPTNIEILTNETGKVYLKFNYSKSCEIEVINYTVLYTYLRRRSCNATVAYKDTKFKTVPENKSEFELENLEPYSVYKVIVKVNNQMGSSPGWEKVIETQNTDEISGNEFPSKVAVNNTDIIIKQASCEKVMGQFKYVIEISCQSQWCINKTNKPIFKDYDNNSTEIYIDVPSNLYPYSNYSVSLKLIRITKNGSYGKLLEYPNKNSFISKPEKPPKVGELQVYSRNGSNIWLRWKAPYPPHGKLLNYLLFWRPQDGKIAKNYEQCELWKTYTCAVIGNLTKNVLYTVSVHAVNENVKELSEKAYVANILTKEAASEAPSFVSYNFTNTELHLFWNHPFITNGPIKQFYITLTSTDANGKPTKIQHTIVKNITMYETTYKELIQYNTSTTYNVTVKAINDVAGAAKSIEIVTPPPKPLLSSNPYIQFCTNVSCTITVPRPFNITLNSALYLIAVNSIKVKKNCTLLKKAFTKKCFEQILAVRSNVCGYDHWIALKTRLNKTSKPLGLQLGKHNDGDDDHIIDNSVLSNTKFVIIFVLVNSYKNQQELSIYSLTYKEFSKGLNLSLLVMLGLTLFPVILLSVVLFLIYRKCRMTKTVILRKQSTSQIAENEYEYPDEIINANNRSSSEPVYSVPLEPIELKSNDLSNTIKLDNLEDYLKKYLEGEINTLTEEYDLLPKGQMYSWKCGTIPENKTKNTFSNLIAYDHTRVVLKNLGNEQCDYINANYVDGYEIEKAYIATQDPTTETVCEFFHMLFQEQTTTVIMLMNIFEDKKQTFVEYWPSQNQTKVIQNFSIRNLKTDISEYYTIRKLEIESENKSLQIQHLQFTSWPDFGLPLYSQTIISFMREVEKIPKGQSPVVIHCRDGVGRVGTLILCDVALKMLLRERQVDFLNILYKMRQQRVNFVDNVTQYILAHFIVYGFLYGENFSIIMDQNFQENVEKVLETNEATSLINYLNKIKWQDQMFRKNLQVYSRVYSWRYPRNYKRPIHAVSVDCFQTPNKFLVTHQPLDCSIGNFWRLVLDHNVNLLVSLHEIEEDSLNCVFWPEVNNEINPIDFIKISCVTHIETTIYDYKKLTLVNKIEKSTRMVEMLTMKGWRRSTLVPSKLNNLLDTIEEMFNLASTSKDPILVTCHDGATASGLFVALSFLLEKMKLVQLCDVALAIRIVRLAQSKFMQEKEQVDYLYLAALEYLKSFEAYSNFKQ